MSFKDEAHVHSATTWKQALDAVALAPVDLMIIDFSVTAINGHALIRYFTKTRSKTFPMLILTSSHTIELIHALLALGVEGFVSVRAEVAVIQQAIETVAAGQIFFPTEYKDALHGHIQGRNIIDLDFSTADLEIVRLTANGLTSSEVAHSMGYSVRTVETKKHRMMQKLHATTSAHLVFKASAYGLLR